MTHTWRKVTQILYLASINRLFFSLFYSTPVVFLGQREKAWATVLVGGTFCTRCIPVVRTSQQRVSQL